MLSIWADTFRLAAGEAQRPGASHADREAASVEGDAPMRARRRAVFEEAAIKRAETPQRPPRAEG